MEIDIINEQEAIEEIENGTKESLFMLKWEVDKSYKSDYEQAEVRDITKEEYDELCSHETLTDEEAQQVVKFSNKNDIVLDLWLTKITDNQAQILSDAFRLELNWLTNITLDQLKKLSKKEGLLALDWLKSLTEEQALILSNIERLHLNWVEYLTDKQVALLLWWNVEILELKWLKRITDVQAGLLSKSRNPLLGLHINDSILTPRQRQILYDKNVKVTIELE